MLRAPSVSNRAVIVRWRCRAQFVDTGRGELRIARRSTRDMGVVMRQRPHRPCRRSRVCPILVISLGPNTIAVVELIRGIKDDLLSSGNSTHDLRFGLISMTDLNGTLTCASPVHDKNTPAITIAKCCASWDF